MVGAMMNDADTARFNALTPEEKRAKTVKNCIEIEQGFAFKLYSELTPEERRMKASCDVWIATGHGPGGDDR